MKVRKYGSAALGPSDDKEGEVTNQAFTPTGRVDSKRTASAAYRP